MTRLETLATQANRSGEVTVKGDSTVFIFFYLFIDLLIYLSIYLFTHSSTYERLSTLPGSIFPTRRCIGESFAILIIIFSFFFLDYFKVSIHLITASVQGKIRNKREKKMCESVVHFSNGHHYSKFDRSPSLSGF